MVPRTDRRILCVADYAIYLQDWPQLDYDTNPSYTLVVECKEAISAAPASSSGTFIVYITENTAPTMAISTGILVVCKKSLIKLPPNSDQI